MRGFWLLLASLALFAPPLLAQKGDREGEAQPEVWRRFDVPPAPVLSPQEALSSFRLAPGFRLELVAAEPLVVDPVALAWDHHGRLWVVEMRGFMPNVDGVGEDAPVGQVVVLEDVEGDGVMDRSTVFLRRLVNPRAIAVVEDGILVGEPPNLWYARDTDGDLVCDHKERVAAYGDPDPDQLEHTENGLLWALDNWIYNAKSSRRFQWRGGRVVEQETEFRGQWGIAQDDEGRLYFNSNSRYLSADLYPSAYLERNPSARAPNRRPPGLYERIVEDESVHTIRVNPGINRGYRQPMLRPDGRLARTTAVSGLAIYRGDQFPAEYLDHAFVPEPAGNVVSHFELWNEGVEIRSRKRLYADPDWGRREFLASTDERFRPVDCAVGPDGALYVVDMYRGILQHRQFVTTYLRKQILERELDKPVGLGRIYRVVHEGPSAEGLPGPSLDTRAGRLEALFHPNGWWRDTAQRLLVEAADREAVPALRRLATEGSRGLGRLHALWTLHGLDATDAPTVRRALEDPDPRVRGAALRTGEALLAGDQPSGLLPGFAALTRDPDARVRLQAMLSLGQAAHEEAARTAMLELLRREVESPYLRQAALSGLGAREIEVLTGLLGDEAGLLPRQGEAELLEALAAAALRRSPHWVQEVLGRVGSVPGGASWRQVALADAVLAVWEETEEAPLPVLEASLSRLDGVALPAAVTERLDRLRELLRSRRAAAPARPLTRRESRLLERGARLYSACKTCHKADGRGQVGEAPSLVDSPWVLEAEARLIRIVLHGLQGPLVIDGVEWDTIMPGHGQDAEFTDKNVAGLLTYLRRQWGHRAAPVDPRTVARVRRETRGRRLPWTVEELLEIE